MGFSLLVARERGYFAATAGRDPVKFGCGPVSRSRRPGSGEPADKVNLILNAMGNTSDETVLEVNDEHLLTLDKDGKTRYDRKRVKKDDKPKP
jgi:hypothetical protein